MTTDDDHNLDSMLVLTAAPITKSMSGYLYKRTAIYRHLWIPTRLILEFQRNDNNNKSLSGKRFQRCISLRATMKLTRKP